MKAITGESQRYALLFDYVSHKFDKKRRVVTLSKEECFDEEYPDFSLSKAKLGAWVTSFYGSSKQVVRYASLGEAVKFAQFELIKPSESYYMTEIPKIMRELRISANIKGIPVNNRATDYDSHGTYVSVVPIDNGVLVYREIGQEVRFGLPIVTFVSSKDKIRVKKRYDLRKMITNLEETIKEDKHWLPESLH